MEQPSIVQLATQYRDLVQTLAKSQSSLPPEQVLACLVSRDRIAHLWKEGLIEPAAAQLIDEGDRQLRGLQEPISQLKELDRWRGNFKPASEAWWWHLQPSTGWLRRFDWLFTAFALLCLTLSAGLITDIAPRLLEGGPDTRGAIVVVLQTVVVLLTTGSVLTKAGQEAAQHILDSLNIPKHWRQEIAALTALLLLLGLYGYRQSLPNLAITYNDNGLASYCAGQLTSAQFNYQRALKLNPDYLEAHYNLGQLYEDLADFQQAKTEYLIALQGGLTAAYNSLARLYILEEEYAAAIPLLQAALLKVEQGQVRDKLVGCQADPQQPEQGGVSAVPVEVLQYELLKNLGWARLGQGRYDEAQPHLEAAIALIADQAPAYCLHAQVLDELGDSQAALVDWEHCLQYASSSNPDEDRWIGLARRRFQAGAETEENN